MRFFRFVFCAFFGHNNEITSGPWYGWDRLHCRRCGHDGLMYKDLVI